MIVFESLHVENFAVFSDITLDFSDDTPSSLTVIRGENESGKTTLMRSFVWGIFGEQALPRIPDVRHPIRPVWAEAGKSVKTRVEIKMRVKTERGDMFYKLSRTAETQDDGQRVRYINETARLLRRDGVNWEIQSDEAVALFHAECFPRELRDFYFVDADKAVDFVGGPEGRHSDQIMRDSTTQSLRALLGLEAMLQAKDRLDSRRAEFDRQAGSQSGDLSQQKNAEELAVAQSQLEAARTEYNSLSIQEKEAQEAYDDVDSDLENRLGQLEELEDLNNKRDDLKDRLQAKQSERNECITSLAALMNDERLYASLFISKINSAIDELQPLKDQGYIPPSELTLLPRLIDRGECVCGISFEEYPERAEAVLNRIKAAKETKESSRFLDQVLESSRRLGNKAIGNSDTTWLRDASASQEKLAELDPKIGELEGSFSLVEKERESASIPTAVLKEKMKHRKSLLDQLEDIKALRDEKQYEINRLVALVRSLGEKIRIATTAGRRSARARACSKCADDLSRIVEAAYNQVQERQVNDVSDAMNRIFRDVISATDESLFEKVGIQMTSEVRGRTLFEPYAYEGGRLKPLALANGASRRAIGVSFILAMAEETQSRIPVVADSLLHSMSGSVKRKIVDYLSAGDRMGQVILFATRSDLADEDVATLVRGRVGKTYTLTSQAHAGGDVLRRTPEAAHVKQTVICDCGIDSFCLACERVGDAERAKEGRIDGPRNSHVIC